MLADKKIEIERERECSEEAQKEEKGKQEWTSFTIDQMFWFLVKFRKIKINLSTTERKPFGNRR